jgi:SDR family mycofactocin-dependent oxidoreductase
MSGQFEHKVVLVTGAARGQGRSHSVRFAEEGADIIAVDICDQIDSVAYPMATADDLKETVNLVEKTGQRIVAEQADVRDMPRLRAAIHHGVTDLGRLDFVLANAGIGPVFDEQSHTAAAYLDTINVDLNGVYFTIEAALPAMLRHADGGAIVITSSAVGFKSASPTYATKSHGSAGYTTAKHGVIGLMRYYATILAEKNIRVNTVHPSVVATPMAINPQADQYLAENPGWATAMRNLLPIPILDVEDVTAAMVYLCGQSGRYITGTTLVVDAGFGTK